MYQIMWLYHIIILVAITLMMCIGWWYYTRYIGLLDRPGSDIKPPRNPVPTMQWVVLVVTFLVVTAILLPDYYYWWHMNAILIGLWLITLMTIGDEVCFLFPSYKKKRLVICSYPLTRLCIMISVALCAYLIGWIALDEVSLWSFIVIFPIWISLIATVWRFVLFINAINRIDGINGISTGICSIGFITIYLLITFVVMPLYTVIEPEVIMAQQLSLILFVISICYAYIERKPLWLVRDCGVMFLGYMLAYLALLWWGKIGIVIVALGLVMFDAARVIINRVLILRKSPLKWDLTHLHHRLLALWRSRSEVRVFVWLWSIFLMIIMLLQWDNTIHKIIIFVIMACIFFWINIYLFWIKKLPSEWKR